MFSLTACALKCYCAHFINTIKDLRPTGCHNDTCETDGVCAVEFLRDGGNNIVRYQCIEDVHDQVSTVHISCSIREANHYIECCNTSNNCNTHIQHTFPPSHSQSDSIPPSRDSNMPPPPLTTSVIPTTAGKHTATVTPTPSDSNGEREKWGGGKGGGGGGMKWKVA